MNIKIADIVIDQAMQHRPMDEEYIDALVQALASGAIPSIQVISTGSQFIMWDGFHRLEAHKRAGFSDIDADVYDGDRLAAWKASLSANARHGMRRKRAEIVAIVEACLRNPETAYLKSVEMAELIDVPAATVRKIKQELRAIEREVVKPESVAAADVAVSTPAEVTATDLPPAAAAPEPGHIAQDSGQPPQRFRQRQMSLVRKAINILIQALEELNLFDELRPELVRIKEVVGLV